LRFTYQPRKSSTKIRQRLPRHRRSLSIECLEQRRLLAASAYTWQNVAIGAGGFVDGIFYDPLNQNVIYARTDIGGLYKTINDGATWTQLLDFVGNNTSTSGNGTQQQLIGVLSFAIDPENSNSIYADVGEYSGTNGAVFYSTNGGQTWGQTNLSFYVGGNSNGRGDGEQIAVDPNNSNIVFLGSNDSGLWESTDAGHSFTRISGSGGGHSSGLDTNISTTFVLFDPTGTPGNASQTIYLGSNSTSSGTNLFKTTNGGTSWTQVAIASGSGPSGYLPGHAVLSGGNLYLGYANAEAPNGSITNGGVYRYTPSTGAWANISPVATSGNFGYDGVAADPQNPNTIVVTSFDYYSGPDMIWRTVNANTTAPTWTALYDQSSAQNFGYGGYDTTRNTSNAPWIAGFGDGISNWAATVAINPFNSNQLMYGTGQGIWATDNASNNGANTELTTANSWYFPDTGIEFTAVGGVVAGSSGVPLYSAMGDILGFAHTTLTSSPAQGTAAYFGSGNNVDVGGNVVVIVGSITVNGDTENGVYSTNGGQTFTQFATNPGGGTNYSQDTAAVSADGSTIVWSQSGLAPFYSTNDGTTWTASGGGMATNGQIIADRVNPNYFYYYVGSSVYVSSNKGTSFTLLTSTAPSGGSIAVNPFTTGDLWIAASSGVYEKGVGFSSFSKVSSAALTSTNGVFALGAHAPGQTVPAIYVFGTIGGFLGVYRSDDGGSTWTQLNDTSHQWGGLLQTFAADPNVFGRLYIGINGRGIIMGNPASSLPTGWVDTDVNSPGNPGWATSSTTLSTGTTINQWTMNGGGAGINLSGDQFNFAYEPESGSASVSAQILGMTDADGTNGTPLSGVMFRAGTSTNVPFVEMVQTASGSLVFEYRTTTGGGISATSISSIPVGAEFVKVVRSGNSFSGEYSSNGINWTSLGLPIAIATMPTTIDVGLAVTANYNSQLSSAKFANVVVYLKGDINNDGHVNAGDIGAMMQALANLSTYQSSHNLSPTDLITIADINGDGRVTNADLQALINLLIGGGGSFSSDADAASPPASDNNQDNASTLIQTPAVSSLSQPAVIVAATAAPDSSPVSSVTNSVQSTAATDTSNSTDPVLAADIASIAETSDKTSTDGNTAPPVSNGKGSGDSLFVVAPWAGFAGSPISINAATLPNTTESKRVFLASVDQFYDGFDPRTSVDLWPPSSPAADGKTHHDLTDDPWADLLLDSK